MTTYQSPTATVARANAQAKVDPAVLARINARPSSGKMPDKVWKGIIKDIKNRMFAAAKLHGPKYAPELVEMEGDLYFYDSRDWHSVPVDRQHIAGADKTLRAIMKRAVAFSKGVKVTQMGAQFAENGLI